MTPRLDAHDMIERSEAAESSEKALAHEPTEKAEKADPMQPTQPTDPIEPIERTDPFEPMLSTESVERIQSMIVLPSSRPRSAPSTRRYSRTVSRARMALTVVTVVALLAAALGGVAAWRGWFSEPSVSAAPDRAPAAVTDVVTDLRAPWGLAFRPDGSALVTERDTARILTVQGNAARELTVVDEAAPSGEGGLLGIAVAPGDDWVYVYYTAADDNRIARFRPDRPDTRETIFTGIPKAGNHNGGRIAFGPDGMLYAGTGDAGQRDAAQDRASLGGKILRLTPDGAPAPGNPFGATPVYSYGHRNVQGLAWDASGAMFASEFGQNTYDELNRIEPGRNYGWPEAEGTSSDPAFTNPIATWRTADASPSGIAVGPDGKVWMACLRGERLYTIGADGSGAQALLRGEHGRLRHVAAAPDGSMWVLTSNHDGRGNPAPGDDRILRLTV